MSAVGRFRELPSPPPSASHRATRLTGWSSAAPGLLRKRDVLESVRCTLSRPSADASLSPIDAQEEP
jgi:hypothetical protein